MLYLANECLKSNKFPLALCTGGNRKFICAKRLGEIQPNAHPYFIRWEGELSRGRPNLNVNFKFPLKYSPLFLIFILFLLFFYTNNSNLNSPDNEIRTIRRECVRNSNLFNSWFDIYIYLMKQHKHIQTLMSNIAQMNYDWMEYNGDINMKEKNSQFFFLSRKTKLLLAALFALIQASKIATCVTVSMANWTAFNV